MITTDALIQEQQNNSVSQVLSEAPVLKEHNSVGCSLSKEEHVYMLCHHRRVCHCNTKQIHRFEDSGLDFACSKIHAMMQ